MYFAPFFYPGHGLACDRPAPCTVLVYPTFLFVSQVSVVGRTPERLNLRGGGLLQVQEGEQRILAAGFEEILLQKLLEEPCLEVRHRNSREENTHTRGGGVRHALHIRSG